MVGRTNEDLERRRGVSEEVLWVSKDGDCRATIDGLRVRHEHASDFTGEWVSGLPSSYEVEYNATVIALFRERALGVKCDEMGMGRP